MSSRLQRASDAIRVPCHLAGDRLHGSEVTFGGDGESGLENVHAKVAKLVRHAQLFFVVHGAAGGLLAVAQCGVEEDDLVWITHRTRSLSNLGVIITQAYDGSAYIKTSNRLFAPPNLLDPKRGATWIWSRWRHFWP